MKFLISVVLPIAIVIALIAAATFVAHYIGPAPKTSQRFIVPAEKGSAAAFPLEPLFATSWNDLGLAPLYSALLQEGQWLCWFRNGAAEPVRLNLLSRSPACTRVEIAVLLAEERRTLVWQTTTGVSALVGNGTTGWGLSSGLPHLNNAWKEAVPTDAYRWEGLGPLQASKSAIPARGLGVLRLCWKGESLGKQLIGVELRRADPASQGQRVGVPVSIVPAIQVAPPAVRLAELNREGQKVTAEFHCWSTTHADFPLTARCIGSDPCVRVQPERLGAGELETLGRLQATSPRAGYRVRVAVVERTEKELLELGPLQRRIEVRSLPELPTLVVVVNGIVRGPVKVGAGADQDQLDLGTFPARHGSSKTLVLTTDSPGLELAVAAQTPASLQVALERSSGKRWELRVRVPPGAAQGRLPNDSAVTLKLTGKTERRLRIPIAGQATQ